MYVDYERFEFMIAPTAFPPQQPNSSRRLAHTVSPFIRKKSWTDDVDSFLFNSIVYIGLPTMGFALLILAFIAVWFAISALKIWATDDRRRGLERLWIDNHSKNA